MLTSFSPSSWNVPSQSATKPIPLVPSPGSNFKVVQAIDGAELYFFITLSNISIADVPFDAGPFQTFVEVIESSVHNVVVSLNWSSDVTLVQLAGVPIVSHRRLRRLLGEIVPTLDFEFVTLATRECFVANCSELAVEILSEYSSALVLAFENGTFDTQLHARALELDVVSLEQAEILDGSYKVVKAHLLFLGLLQRTPARGMRSVPRPQRQFFSKLH